MTVLHVGTFDTARLRDSLSPDIGMTLDSDSWEEWGESIVMFPNHPLHVVLLHDDSLQLLTELAKIMDAEPGLLVPMAYHRQRGVLASITPESDWSEPHYTIIDTQAQRFLARNPGTKGDDVDSKVWHDLAWQDYLYLAETEPGSVD